MKSLNPTIHFAVALLMGSSGCRRTSVAANPKEQPPTTWASQPVAQWPQLVLTNSTSFKGHTALEGASSFLIRTPDGKTMAATALHLLGVNGGVKPTLAPADLPQALSMWQMFPRTQPESVIHIAGSGCLTKAKSDWLLLDLADPSGKLPSTPLSFRLKPAEIGEELYLVGVPYSEPDRAQNVYRCKVTARQGSRFRYSVDPPVDITGFSGAPVIDKAGLAVGVMSVWFSPRMQGEKYLEAGAEDASIAVEILATKH